MTSIVSRQTLDHETVIQELLVVQFDVAVHLRDLLNVLSLSSNRDIIELKHDIIDRLNLLIDALEETP